MLIYGYKKTKYEKKQPESVAKTQVLKAFRHLLRPIVRVLLRNGVTWKEFAELGKEVFVDVARNDYGIEGRPTNVARVALMTGLRRHEVTRIKNVLAGDEEAEEPAPNRISQILTAWHVDPDFLAADGAPAVLPAAGEGASLATLLKRYAGDMPHTAVLKELELLGLVESKGDRYRVTSRDYIRSAADPDLLRQAAVALHDHATTLAHNVDSKRTEPPRFERMATHRALPRRHVKAFRELLALEGQAFLERMDAWLSDRATTAKKGATRERTVRAGVGVYLIQDDEREERQ
jgi:hypothetical protein